MGRLAGHGASVASRLSTALVGVGPRAERRTSAAGRGAGYLCCFAGTRSREARGGRAGRIGGYGSSCPSPSGDVAMLLIPAAPRGYQSEAEHTSPHPHRVSPWPAGRLAHPACWPRISLSSFPRGARPGQAWRDRALWPTYLPDKRRASSRRGCSDSGSRSNARWPAALAWPPADA